MIMLIAIYTYQLFSILASPFIFLWILYRANKGKEDLARLKERLGFATASKAGRIIWLHAASVGETMMALSLVRNLTPLYPNHKFLLTTGTLTSASMVAKRTNLTLIHQYVPVDVSYCVNRFLRHWQPEVGIFLESEIWPNLIYNASQKLPIILVNAKLSDKSYQKWSIYKPLSSVILNQFKLILTQTKDDANKFLNLGASNVITLGNLKFSNAKPTFDQSLFEKLQQQTNNRRILLAASTHEGDEEFIVFCYQALKSKYENLLLIIAPRHPHRSFIITKVLDSKDLKYSVRTLNQNIDPQTDVYLADTVGELGLFFSLANISFIGGSLRNGGHNIIEPSFFKTMIIFGPDMANFAEIADEYITRKAALSFKDFNQAVQIIDHCLTYPDEVDQKMAAANEILEQKKQILTSYLKHIGKFIKQ